MNIRGRKAHMTLFGPEVCEDEAGDERPGRDPELLRQRNVHILYRYAWYARQRPTDYLWCVGRLKADFYLSESTLGQLIEDSAAELHAIRKENLSTRQLMARFPWW